MYFRCKMGQSRLIRTYGYNLKAALQRLTLSNLIQSWNPDTCTLFESINIKHLTFYINVGLFDFTVHLDHDVYQFGREGGFLPRSVKVFETHHIKIDHGCYAQVKT